MSFVYSRCPKCRQVRANLGHDLIRTFVCCRWLWTVRAASTRNNNPKENP